MEHRTTTPDTAALAGWLHSWVTDEGAINGFHNHSVWGTNPATFLDFTSGHTTFAGPAVGAFAQALAARPDERGTALLRRLLRYQCSEVQPDGQYAHIGFQVGESATSGLIHNAVGSLGMLLAVRHAGHLLPADEVAAVLAAVRRNLDACEIYGGGRPGADGTCNQEYARVWVKQLYTELSDDKAYADQIPEDLAELVRLFHRRGVPDADSAGTFRTVRDRAEGGILEPAEYYGLMIVPLVLGYRAQGDPELLAEARRLCRHVARSAWTDENGATRYHRYWYVRGERVLKTDTPMLIAGMGLTLYGIHEVLAEGPDAELEAFTEACLATYARYQTPAGYFASASGWHNEADIAPSTAWHAHDLLFLMARDGAGDDFWDRVTAPRERQSVLVGDRAHWAESGVHWSVRSPLTAGDLHLYGRKDRAVFAREFFAWTDREPLPEELRYPDVPEFFVADDGIYRVDRGEAPTDITAVGPLPYRGRL
ncbi:MULTISPECIES: hypothetical protein [Streptomyces]|uniref:hypothetical protein n=1 Tax=Streptomyces TaxID=1883 RepID=UPI00240DED37|nr:MULTISPECIES: hypothetical protein [Streptomyces]WFB82343.1 hypothetical protein MMU79_02910 [Streptomyces olivaceus]WGK44679.1 hypothetical protein M6G09_03135 [Streptomyces sp. B146]